jgi:hypothetical protein
MCKLDVHYSHGSSSIFAYGTHHSLYTRRSDKRMLAAGTISLSSSAIYLSPSLAGANDAVMALDLVAKLFIVDKSFYG